MPQPIVLQLAGSVPCALIPTLLLVWNWTAQAATTVERAETERIVTSFMSKIVQDENQLMVERDRVWEV